MGLFYNNMLNRSVEYYIKLLFYVIFLLLFSEISFAQHSSEIDSLKIVAENSPDKDKSKEYCNLCWKLRNHDPEQALEYGKIALEYAQKFDDTVQILKSYSFVGVCQRNLGDYQSAYNSYDEGLAMALKAKNKEQTAYFHINIGNLYLYHDEFENAEKHLHEALALGKVINDSSILAYSYLNLGRICISLKNNSRATAYLLECLQIRERTEKEWDKIATVKKYLGDAASADGNFNTALKYYKAAVIGNYDIKDYDLLSDLYGRISEAYLSIGNTDSALVYAKEGLRVTEMRKIPVRIKNAYKYLGNVYRAKGNYAEALKAYDVVMLYGDTVYTEWKNYGMTNIEYQINMVKKDSELKLLTKDYELKNSYLVIEGLVLLLILGTAVMLVIRYVRTRKINKLLKSQKDEIEARNEEISSQRDILAVQKKEITDSITYAQRIQFSMLSDESVLKDYFSDGFIFYKPRDVVSGDFYKIFSDKDYFVLLAADCTGHGVPGAFMSMLGMAAFNEIVGKEGIRNAGDIMNLMREMIKKTLKQDINDSMKTQDGMDAALIIVDRKTDVLYYSGAHIPFLCYRGGEEISLRPVHNPVGVYICERPFVSVEFPLQKGDKIYLSTDGYHSQFGGDSDRVLKTSGYKKILREVLPYKMGFQKKLIEDRFLAWQGDKKQTDDVLVIGLEV